MKFGVCIGVKDYEKIKIIKACGGDYIECGLSSFSDLSLQDVKEFNTFLLDTGITCEVTNCFFPGNFRLTGENVDKQILKDYLESVFDKISSIGIKCIVFGSGGSRHIPDGFPVEKAYEQIIDISKNIIDPIASSYKIKIALELLNRGETNFINDILSAMRISDGVNSAWYGQTLDLYHLAVEKADLNQIALCKDKIFHLHIANPVGRIFPSSTDECANDGYYKQFFTHLKKAGYDERLSIEAKPAGEFAEITKDALSCMRKLWAEA